MILLVTGSIILGILSGIFITNKPLSLVIAIMLGATWAILLEIFRV